MKNSRDEKNVYKVVLYDDRLLFQVAQNQKLFSQAELVQFALANKRKIVLRFNKILKNSELWEKMYFKFSIKLHGDFSVSVKNQRGETVYKREGAKRKSLLPEGKLFAVENLCQIALMQTLLQLWKEQTGDEIVVKYLVDTGHMSQTELPLLRSFAQIQNVKIEFCRFK